jgi:oligosaccharyltransferase complex subunit alpha (ribophorin I)
LVRENGFPQSPMSVHYPFEEPVKTVEKLVRLVEVSHWGGNMNIEDHVRLVNTGAR